MGFFCIIPDPEIKDKKIKVLLTCYHVVNIKEVDKIIYINHSNKIKRIDLNEKDIKRRYWYNEEFDMDYTCIELLEKDEITDYYFLNIDQNIEFNNYTKENLKDKIVYIFKKGEESTGKIIKIDKTKIIYTNETKDGWSGSPVIRKDNKQVIAIHQGGNKTSYKNLGILIKYILMKMKKKEIKYEEEWEKNSKIIVTILN